MLLTVGNSCYLADELLKSRFSTAADIFGLGIGLLELVCDLEMPFEGEGWHSLRNEELPKDFVKGTHAYTCNLACQTFEGGTSCNYCQSIGQRNVINCRSYEILPSHMYIKKILTDLGNFNYNIPFRWSVKGIFVEIVRTGYRQKVRLLFAKI